VRLRSACVTGDYSVIHGVWEQSSQQSSDMKEPDRGGSRTKVTLVKPGDHVVLSVIANCGYCSFLCDRQACPVCNLGRTLGSARC